MSNDLVLPPWDNDETQRLVHAFYGKAQLMWLKPAMRAIGYRLAHAEYHYHEYKRITKAHIDEKLQAGRDMWEIASPTNDEEAQSTHRFYVECEAHLYAFVQAVHAMADNLAHVVYYVLGLNLDNSFKGRVSLASVEAHMAKCKLANMSSGAVADLLKSLKSSTKFVDLEDLVNQLKHHGGPSVRVLRIGDMGYEVQFDGFLRHGAHRAAVAVDQFLVDSHSVVNVAIVGIGIELNNWLQTLQPQPSTESALRDAI